MKKYRENHPEPTFVEFHGQVPGEDYINEVKRLCATDDPICKDILASL